MFVYDMIMPNGAAGRYHKARRFEVTAEATHAVVDSFHLEAMELVTWQDTYVIPLDFRIETLADVETILTLPGAPFDGGTVIPADEADLGTAKALKRAKLKAKRDQVEWGGIEAPFNPPIGRVQTRPADQLKIARLAMKARDLGETFTTSFRLEDNSNVPLDRDQMVALDLAVTDHVEACQARKDALDALIDASEDLTALQAIDIETGWPG